MPIARQEILSAKWRSAFVAGTAPAVFATTIGLGGASFSETPAFVGAGLVVVAQMALTASLGGWLSVWCRTATRAGLWLAGLSLAIGGLAAVPVDVGPFARAFVPGFGIVALLVPDRAGWPTGAVLAVAVQATAAWLLWRAACQRFASGEVF